MREFVCIFGPTGVGKTALIEGLFCAQGISWRRHRPQRLPNGAGISDVPSAEVISADSMQVYRGFDIGTAKPDIRARSCRPHHLIDICDPHEAYDVGRFVSDADNLIADISSRQKLPVVSGGTAFYFKHLLYGLPEAPPSNPLIRSELEAELASQGVREMYSRLNGIDPEAAARIAPTDAYRILRALEVWRTSGHTLSSFHVPSRLRDDVRALVIGLYRDRSHLYERINLRVSGMIDAGLGDEVKGLLTAGVSAEAPAMRAIGYREWLEHGFPEHSDDETLHSIVRRIQKNSRHYAKRQLTFFRRLQDVHWINMGNSPDDARRGAEQAARLIADFCR